jgi:hypothetical protein
LRQWCTRDGKGLGIECGVGQLIRKVAARSCRAESPAAASESEPTVATATVAASAVAGVEIATPPSATIGEVTAAPAAIAAVAVVIAAPASASEISKLLIDQIANLVAVEILVIPKEVLRIVSQHSDGFGRRVGRSSADLQIGWSGGQIILGLLSIRILVLRSRGLKQGWPLLSAPLSSAPASARSKRNDCRGWCRGRFCLLLLLLRSPRPQHDLEIQPGRLRGIGDVDFLF